MQSIGEQVVDRLTGGEGRLRELGDLLSASAACTSGSARHDAARSFSNRYVRMFAAADAHTP